MQTPKIKCVYKWEHYHFHRTQPRNIAHLRFEEELPESSALGVLLSIAYVAVLVLLLLVI